MEKKSIISKIYLPVFSIGVIAATLIYLKDEKVTDDLFYTLTIFSLALLYDFLLYEIGSDTVTGKLHCKYCLFPILRRDLMLQEICRYLTRKKIIFFILSTLFYVCSFLLSFNSNITTLLIVNALTVIQLVYFICFLFAVKNTLNTAFLASDLRNFVSLFTSGTVMVIFFANNCPEIKSILYLNPFSCGFLSFLAGIRYWKSLAVIAIISVTVFLILKKKFVKWPI